MMWYLTKSKSKVFIAVPNGHTHKEGQDVLIITSSAANWWIISEGNVIADVHLHSRDSEDNKVEGSWTDLEIFIFSVTHS